MKVYPRPLYESLKGQDYLLFIPNDTQLQQPAECFIARDLCLKP